jgi:predicted TIM-barrel fold metal-dependent hydrolase
MKSNKVLKIGNSVEGMNRRQFLSFGGAAVLGASVPGMVEASTANNEAKVTASDSVITKRGSYKDMVREAVGYKKIDVHNHTGNLKDMIESMDRVGIQWSAISDLSGGNDPQSFRRSNDIVLQAMKEYPNRILGQCRINPGYTKEALQEIDRCVDQGMVMLGELYDEYKINDPVYYPIIERCIEHKIPLLVHAAATLGLWRKGYPTIGSSLTTSIAEDFVDVGKRYPEAMIISGHIGGGGDWEYAIRILREAPSIYAETSGSVADEAMIDLAIENLGVDRLLFATDVNYETGVGKVMCANLSKSDRKKIFFDNFNNLLRKGGNNVA